MSSIISQLSQQQISSLLAAEQQRLSQPISNWQSQIKTDQVQLSAWGKIASTVSSLNTSVNAISDPTSFDNRGITSSDSGVATATVQRGATQGNYSLTNVNLAQAQSVYSKTYASASVSLGSSTGSLTFQFGSGSTETVQVTAADMTPAGIAQAINQVSGSQVHASLVGGSTGERLVLTGAQTGSSQSFTVSGSGVLSQLDYAGGSSGSMTLAQAARNATLNVNGIPISSATNTLTSAIPSASVTLTGSGSTTLAVNVDASGLSQAVSSVVSDLNSAVSTIAKETAYQPASSNGSGNSQAKAGPLLGNFTAQSMANQLLSAVSGLSTSGLSGRDIGITVSKDGSVSFDSGAFQSAYQSNPSAVETLVQQLYSGVQSITSSATGVAGNGTIDARQNSLNSSINSLQSEITQQTKFVQAQMAIYAQQYSQLVSAQSKLSVTSNYLSLLSASGSGSGNNGG